MFDHHLVPSRRARLVFRVNIFFKMFRIKMANEFLMRLTDNTGQCLKITNIQTTSRTFNKNFIEIWLDRFPLRLFNIKTSEICKPRRHHIPGGDGFFSVKVCRRGPKRVNTQRKPLASQRRPYPHLTSFKQFLCSTNISVLGFKIRGVNPHC